MAIGLNLPLGGQERPNNHIKVNLTIHQAMAKTNYWNLTKVKIVDVFAQVLFTFDRQLVGVVKSNRAGTKASKA